MTTAVSSATHLLRVFNNLFSSLLGFLLKSSLRCQVQGVQGAQGVWSIAAPALVLVGGLDDPGHHSSVIFLRCSRYGAAFPGTNLALRECAPTAVGRKTSKPPREAYGRPFLDFHILLDTKNGWKVPQPQNILLH
jgi:hypothetical protein